jgi:hypothetical protein
MDATQQAHQRLAEVLEAVGERPLPADELQQVCHQLREGFEGGDWRYELLAVTTRTDPRSLPDDDQELWLALAVGVIRPGQDPPHAAEDDEAYANWHALQVSDWLGAVAGLARSGPGAPADANALAGYAVGSADVSELRDDEPSLDALAPRFRPADVLWRALGAIDADAELTPLGWWGIPEAALRAWR